MPYFSYDNKRIYYEEHGKGNPVIFCHGNTASSRMFSLLMPLYENDLHCILIDFLGCGRSDRIASFSSDIWIDEAKQVVSLTRYLELDEVSLIGTSVFTNRRLIRWPHIEQLFLFKLDKGKRKCNER